MRKKHTITIKNQVGIILMASLFLFASCNGSNVKNDKVSFSENGIALADKAVSSFQLLNETLKKHQYDSETIRILTDHSPSTWLMQLNESKSAIIESNIKKQSAFILYRKAFSSYNLILDRNFDFNSSNLKDRLYTACAALDSFETDDFYKERVQVLKNQISGGHFKEDVAILELSTLYADIWDNDAQKWFMLLENELNNYKEGINKVAHSSFDVSKIKTLVNEPYNDNAVLVNLYKLQLVKEKELQTEIVMDEIQNVSAGFGILLELNAEFAKKKSDKQRINKLNNQLDAIVTNGSILDVL